MVLLRRPMFLCTSLALLAAGALAAVTNWMAEPEAQAQAPQVPKTQGTQTSGTQTLGATAAAQSPQAGDFTVLAREALTRPGAYALLTGLCTAAPHRLAGSPGAEAAVRWAQDTMVAIGLENVRLEPCLVPHWERGTLERLAVVSAGAAPEPLAVAALGGSPPTPSGGLEAEVIRVLSLAEVAKLGPRARGKAIFFDRPMDPTEPNPFAAYGGAVDQRSSGSTTAAAAGAAFAIVRSMTLASDDVPHTGAMRYVEGACVPTVAISTLGAERLAKRLAAGAPVRVKLELDCRWFEDAPSANVVGELVGRERPEEIVVLGGHLDAWDQGVGAHDDGAGCVHALEAVRLIRTLGWKPRRTLRVVLWANEENGTRGAHAYRDAHLAELDRHVFALESDRGGFVPRGFECDASESALAQLAAIGRRLEPYGIGFVRASRHVGVDIGPLQEHGVPCAGFVPDASRYFDVHHSANDTLAAVHPRELELGALCVAALAYAVADLEAPLERTPKRAEPAATH